MVPAGILVLLGLIGIGVIVVLAVHEEIDQRRRLGALEQSNEVLRQLVSDLYTATPLDAVNSADRQAFERFLSLAPRRKTNP